MLGLFLGIAAGSVIGMVLGPSLLEARHNGSDAEHTPPFDSTERGKPRNLLEQIRQRIEDALAAGKEEAQGTEERLKRRYQDSVKQSQRRG